MLRNRASAKKDTAAAVELRPLTPNDIRYEITAEYIKSRLHYDPGNGVFTWLARPVSGIRGDSFNSKFVGKPAGHVSQGYVRITLDGVCYMASRLAWIYTYGYTAPVEVDHRDRIRSNTRIKNLRLANDQQNACNRSIHANNTSGFKGVSWNIQHRKWQAYICVKGRQKTLGVFKDKQQAVAAYDTAALRLYGSFAAPNSNAHAA